MTETIEIGGVSVPLEPTPSGPLVSTTADPRLEPLAWVVNAGLTGMLAGLRERVAAGEDAVVQGLAATRPDPREDHSAAAAVWRQLTGTEAGADAYLVGTTFSEHDLLLPRVTLLEILDGLARLRASATGG